MSKMYVACVVAIVPVLFAGCASDRSAKTDSNANQLEATKPASGFVIEVTTFNRNDRMTESQFARADAAVEARYTSKQPGFLGRVSGESPDGTWAVVVYWEDAASAEASMKKFMNDASVVDYAAAIDATTMKMSHYRSAEVFQSDGVRPRVVEVTTFVLKADVAGSAFSARDAEIESAYTARQPGFIARHSGESADGQWAVIVFWDDISSADASMKKFIRDESVADYTQMIDGSAMAMSRYETR